MKQEINYFELKCDVFFTEMKRIKTNEFICSKFEDDNLQIINPYFLQSKNQITEKQKTYIKNLFYQYYILSTER